MEKSSYKITQFVKRPALGHEGIRLRIRSNFFEVTSLPHLNISQYDVTIIPEVPKNLNRRIFKRFVEQNRIRFFGGANPVYDGRRRMFSNKVLPFGQTATFDTILEEETNRTPRKFKIVIKKVGRDINMEELVQFLNARSRMTNNCQMAITAIDLIIGYKISTSHITVSRSFYTPQGALPITGGVELWQGYYQSARPTKGKMMINIDLSATVFYEPGPLIQTIMKILGCRNPDELYKGLSDKDRHKVDRVIRNLKIRTNHLYESKRTHKIEKLTPTAASNTTFQIDDSIISVQHYFQSRYNRKLIYPLLPCVIIKKNIYLPIEVCDVEPGQRFLRKLNKKQTNEMIGYARKVPFVRCDKIRNSINTLNYKSDEYLQEFGMSVSNDMTVVEARVLPAPTVFYHPSSRENSIQPKNGSWNLQGKKVATGATLGSWAVVAFLAHSYLPDENIPNRNPPILRANPQGNIEDSLKQAWLKAGNTAKAQPQLILCILPNTGIQLYAEIKRVSDTVIGVSTQCVQSQKIRQVKKQYCANLCLKINVKLGGMNSFIEAAQIPFITDVPTILIGADVSHPPPGPDGNNRPSFAALCGSMDAKASRYAASIRVQTGRVEIIADLANMVKELLKTFYQTCGQKPQRILFYRDGVSDGQFENVYNNEITAIKNACYSLGEHYKPSITFVVVRKRHHTRFFPMDKLDADKTGNCLPGTVVETGVTHPFEFDFYLQSHAGILGTSRPAHYHVLFDENGFNADSLQTLTYNLCYIYARCTRSVSMVPPVYYAHLISARAKLHVHGDLYSDTESSVDSTGGTATFGVVKQELQRVMYYA
ncbi:hypothetical protein RclHR1_00940014 [Rhizophagus clarus]|uniref:Piwi domain-containing protein n=1 Tax=Rhizophagus clarus TaxID=94130 RepID=A0A2Z6SAE9_9GLOM|nr:hypothetical protein RclHR1_00940014 [Rhizophagus clarus]